MEGLSRRTSILPSRSALCSTPFATQRWGKSSVRSQVASGLCSRHRLLPVAAAAADVVEEKDVPKKPRFRFDYNQSYYPIKSDTENLKKPWFVIDAEGQILGRLASKCKPGFRGKLNPAYTPSMDMGAFVVVINADKVTVSGLKYTDKVYFRHTVGRPGKSKRESFRSLQKRIPEKIIERAVWGMLPKGRLGRKIYHHLKVYRGENHPHEAQKPIDITTMINAKASAYAELLAQQQ